MKYILTNESIVFNGRTLYRIQATRDILDENKNILVRAGEKGGYVESFKNLSHEGSCWIYDEAKAYDDATLIEHACLKDKAEASFRAVLCGRAVARHWAKVSGYAKICDNSQVEEHAHVFGNATIHRNSEIAGYAQVHENADIEFCNIFGKSNIHGNSKLSRCSTHGLTETSGDCVILRCKLFDNAKVYEDTYVQNRDVISDITNPPEKSKNYADGAGK